MTKKCQSDNFKLVISQLTRNEIHVNLDPERFLIVPQPRWDISLLRESILELNNLAMWRDIRRSSSIFRNTVKGLLAEPNQGNLEQTIEEVMAARKNWGISIKGTGETSEDRAIARPWFPRDRTRISELLATFWKAGVLAFPREPILEFKGLHFEIATDWYATLETAIIRTGRDSIYALNKISDLQDAILACCPIHGVGDIVPELLNELPERKGRIRVALHAVSMVLKDKYGNLAPSADEYWPRPKRLQDDFEFSWAIKVDPTLSTWATLASRWCRDQVSNSGVKHQSLRLFIRQLLEQPGIPREPRRLLTRKDNGQMIDLGFDEVDASRYNHIADFLDWVISAQFSTKRDDGILVKNENVINPMEKRKKLSKSPETNKNVMPPWLLKMLVECLTADDWAWAKSCFGEANSSGRKGDCIFKTEDEGGAWIWCPVRAVCLYAKLTFPSRQGQTRHFDSGEADVEVAVFEPAAPEGRRWRMASNQFRVPSALLSTKLKPNEQKRLEHRAHGAVQVASSERRNYLQLRFPTNKTADQDKDAWNRGYTSPWLPEHLAHELIRMRDWQIANNRIVRTTLWADVDEFTKGDLRRNPEYLVGMDSAFLFRDPTSYRPDHPISDSKVRNLYKALCQEVERRCEDIGLTGPDGKPIRLIATYGQLGEISGLVYPLHSLRVSIVTHYVEDGGVSPEVMMKIVGHATVVMTMYYIKHSGEYIADMMTKGDRRIYEKAQRGWIAEAREKDLDDLRRVALGKSEVAFTSFRAAPPGSVLPLSIGVCPTGGGRCHEGGPPIFLRKDEELHAPVPGGRSNCAGCRFLVSGEPWQEGIVSEFNVRSLDVSLKNRHLDELDERLLPLDDERAACMKEGRIFASQNDWRKLTREKEEIEAAQLQLHTEMANLMVLSQQLLRIAQDRDKAGETRMALVVGDIASVETALQESTEFDLVDRICRSADVYPSLVARGTTVVMASLFRARAWDKVLRQQGLEPRFLDLSPEEARRVGNKLTEWLDMRVGRSGTLALMDGTETIQEICRRTGFLPENVLAEMRQEVDSMVPIRIVPRRLQPNLADGAPAMLDAES